MNTVAHWLEDLLLLQIELHFAKEGVKEGYLFMPIQRVLNKVL